MSISTRSKRRSAAVSVNTLISSTKPGNNSMADIDDDAEGSIGEAVGSNILSGHVAPVTLKLGRKHIFPQDLPKFNGT